MRVVLATSNPGKQREFATLLAPRGFELLLQSDLGIAAIEETGNTFEDNALLKARHAAAVSGLPALADDSGIEVDALGGRPGVYSARFAGLAATDEQNNARLIADLAGIDDDKRTARYRCVLAMVRSERDTHPILAQGSWEGSIGFEPIGSGGFGYDPYFIPAGLNCTAAELSPARKNALSHRSAALRDLITRLSTWT